MLTSTHGRQCRLALVLVALVAAPTALAQGPELGPEVEKKVVFETKYRFYVKAYEDPPVMGEDVMSSDLKRPVTAEDMAVRILTAMKSGDVDVYFALSSEEVRRRVQDRLAEDGLSRQDLARVWIGEFEGMAIRFTQQIYRGLDQIIWYELYDPVKQAVREDDGLAFRRGEDGHWEQIDLSGDVVFENWDFDGARLALEATANQP